MGDLKVQPYRPSWLDRANELVDQIPGPALFHYFALALVLFGAQFVVLWLEGAGPMLLPAQVFLAGAIAFILALLRYLSSQAEAALIALRPALVISEDEFEALRFRVTTLPAGRTLVASACVIGVVLLSEAVGEAYELPVLAGFPVSATLLRVLYFFVWWVFGALLYHTIHQLRLINRIYTSHTRINLFQMNPVYAFSNLAAFTAGSLTVLPYGFLIANDIFDPDRLSSPAIALIFAIQAIAILTFLWPQLGIHRLQVAEKARLLGEARQRFEAAIQEFHRGLDEGEHERVGESNMTITTLQVEMKALEAIPTWPWQPETIRWLTTALVLPLGLWIIQSILQRVLSP